MTALSDLFESPTPAVIAAMFADLHPSLTAQAALAEANRCLFCFDAPCVQACPTHIDVPRFIKKIATGNLKGSAQTILDANVLGASCSRACPVEVLCEGACVLHRYNKQPIEIALLQRHAMDTFHASGTKVPFVPGPATGKRVALIGCGPASLSCAAELRRTGHAAEIFDARALPGGLNTYGIAEYKLPLAESLRELEMVARLGVEFHFGVQVSAEMLAQMQGEYDALFLGMGLGRIHRLGVAGEELAGVSNALDLIEDYKVGAVTEICGSVAVIGAGNTAIDAANAAIRLGASTVHMVYRRGAAEMSAFAFEYAHAKQEGVRFLWHVQPVAIEGEGRAERLRLQQMKTTADGSLVGVIGSEFALAVDLVVLAIGQSTHTDWLPASVRRERGRVVIDRATGQTSDARFFAGGDCSNGGREVVDAVADGKRAALGIRAFLAARGDA